MNGIFNIIGFIIWISFLVLMIFTIPVAIFHVIYIFYNSEKRKQKAFEKLNGVLMDSEEMLSSAIQYRPFSLMTRRALVAITPSRIIFLHRKFFGGFNMFDFQWKDLEDAQIDENLLSEIMGSNLKFKYATNQKKFDDTILYKNISILGIETPIANKIYSYSQKQEQEWEEKRRVRKMEETRAASGGFYMSSQNSENNTSQSSFDNTIKDIEKAKTLLDDGIISDAEFQELKSKALGKGY